MPQLNSHNARSPAADSADTIEGEPDTVTTAQQVTGSGTMPRAGSRAGPTLLARLRQDALDPEVWAELVTRLGPAMIRWSRRWKLAGEHLDTTVRTLLSRLSARLAESRPEPGRSLRAGLRAAIRLAWAELIEHRRPSTESGPNSAVGEVGTVTACLDSVPAREDLLERLEPSLGTLLLAEAVAAVSDRLDPKTWEVFAAAVLQGRQGTEVAAVNGLTPVAVLLLKNRALRAVQEEYRRLSGEAT